MLRERDCIVMLHCKRGDRPNASKVLSGEPIGLRIFAGLPAKKEAPQGSQNSSHMVRQARRTQMYSPSPLISLLLKPP